MAVDPPDEPPPWPVDLGYIKCEPCIEKRHSDCIGLTHTRPLCGCRCPWLEVIDDEPPDVRQR